MPGWESGLELSVLYLVWVHVLNKVFFSKISPGRHAAETEIRPQGLLQAAATPIGRNELYSEEHGRCGGMSGKFTG